MKKIVYAVLAFSPMLALAAGASTIVDTTKTWAMGFKDVVNVLIPAFFALAVIYFFYGLAKYIMRASNDPKEAAAGKTIMIYGLIAIAIMASLYGLINFLQTSTGVSSTGTIQLPQVQ